MNKLDHHRIKISLSLSQTRKLTFVAELNNFTSDLATMAFSLPLFLLSFMVTYSNAAVCVCKDASEPDLQKVIDFACGGGADCAQIQTTGACYQPNTVKNHCDVAVNSYYQKKAPTGATCDFNGAAVISTSPPSTTSTCLSSSSPTGTPMNGTPSTGNSTTGNSTTGTPATTYPSTGNSTTTTPTDGRPTSSSLAFPGTTMGPSSSTTGLNSGDPNGGEELSVRTTTIILLITIAAVALRV